MTEACSGQTMTVVIDDHRAIDNLITTIQVNVGYTVVVVTIGIPRVTPTTIVRPMPTFCQGMCAGIDIVGTHLMLRVDTTSKEDAGGLSIKVGSTEEIFRGAVTIGVAPVTGIATRKWIGVRQFIVKNYTRATIHINKVFITCVCVGHVGGMGNASTRVHTLDAYALELFITR